jgi:hypothetical protein
MAVDCIAQPLNRVFCIFFTGNSKKAINFLGAAPSVRAKLRSDASSTGFRELLAHSSNDGHQFQPRNGRQIQYYKSIAAPERKIGADTIVTLHELAYAIPDYIWSIRTYPDLVVCFGLLPLVNLINSGLCTLLSYDTTFNLGDFYLSVLVLKLSAFKESPSIPAAFVVHDRKFKTVHIEFCEQLRMKMKSTSADITPVTDGEAAIEAAFKQIFPQWQHLSCSNHILKDVEMWLKRHNGSASDVMIYKANIRELLQCQSVEEFSTKLSTVRRTWSESFVVYFDAHIAERLLKSYVGHIRSLGLPFDSITTNMSESLNFVIKDFQGWRENTADVCLFSLYQLQLSYMTQINRNTHGYGPYTPASDVQASKCLELY